MATKKSDRSAAGEPEADGLSADERAAVKERAAELRKAKGRAANADQEQDVLDKIAEMAEPDRSMASRVHEIVKATAPTLTCRTWYGMPAYAKDGKVVCFFKSGQKYKERYATLGFNDAASLDDGAMWPTTFALTELTEASERQIAALVARAVR